MTESHHETPVRRCKLESFSLGERRRWQAARFLQHPCERDQMELISAEVADTVLRDIQTIVCSYTNETRDLDYSGGSGGRTTSEGQAMFAGGSRTAVSSQVCPGPCDRATAEVDRKGGLLKHLVRAREARAALPTE